MDLVLTEDLRHKLVTAFVEEFYGQLTDDLARTLTALRYCPAGPLDIPDVDDDLDPDDPRYPDRSVGYRVWETADYYGLVGLL